MIEYLSGAGSLDIAVQLLKSANDEMEALWTK
jgi:hypothetical protein